LLMVMILIHLLLLLLWVMLLLYLLRPFHGAIILGAVIGVTATVTVAGIRLGTGARGT